MISITDACANMLDAILIWQVSFMHVMMLWLTALCVSRNIAGPDFYGLMVA